MIQKSLINQIELAYAPITAYEFAFLKNDKLVEKALYKASLYIIAQRPVITFENVIPDSTKYQLNFEIHQKGNPEILKCKLPLIQPSVDSKPTDNISIAFNFLDKSNCQKNPPLNNIHGFSLVNYNLDKEFLIWFSPEKLLQNWWKDLIICEIEGDYRAFLNYKVHYVGKATKQSIQKRLKAHSTFQDILSLETPVTEKQLPANEIVILPFEFQDNLQIQSFGRDSDDVNSMVSAVLGENFPSQEKVFLDAEKALIKSMKPEYNEQLFENYPQSSDGLYSDNYDAILYSFVDPLTLIYEEGEIVGDSSLFGGDSIVIKSNKEVKLIKKE